MVAVKLLL